MSSAALRYAHMQEDSGLQEEEGKNQSCWLLLFDEGLQKVKAQEEAQCDELITLLISSVLG